MENKKIVPIVILIAFFSIFLGFLIGISYASEESSAYTNNTNVNKVENKTIEEDSIFKNEIFHEIKNKLKSLNSNWELMKINILKRSINSDYYLVEHNYYNFETHSITYGSVLIHNTNNKWDINIIDETSNTDITKKWNDVNIEYIELSDELALKLIDEKKNLNYDTSWEVLNVKVTYRGDNNCYWINYTRSDNETFGLLFQYTESGWNFELPGAKEISEELIKNYNFVSVD